MALQGVCNEIVCSMFMVYPVVQFKRAFSSRQQKNPALMAGLNFFVIPPRFERGTHSLEGCCSVQLSYGTSIFGCKGKKK